MNQVYTKLMAPMFSWTILAFKAVHLMMVSASNLREVHAHVEPFDGSVSPPGFAAVVLIDESHVTAHCYSDRGWLAIDCFTCGGTDPNTLADALHSELLAAIPTLKLMQRTHVPRFLHEG